ncbi:MAG: S-layer family protein [Chloroflexaceae bacterium]|nr:S-layer family protein [Chloroflexaceae bacterium]
MSLDNNSLISASTGPNLFDPTGVAGAGGQISINVSEQIVLDNLSDIQAINFGDGNPGAINVVAGTIVILNGSQISTDSFASGNAGNITVTGNEIQISGRQLDIDAAPDVIAASGIFSSTQVIQDSDSPPVSTGNGGEILIRGGQLRLEEGATISAEAGVGTFGLAGNIVIELSGAFVADNANVSSASDQSSGGAISISAQEIRFNGDSDITTNVNSGSGGGGNISLTAPGGIFATGDSDILSFSSDGTGGDITFDTPGFFGESFRSSPSEIAPEDLDDNNQVDVNASGVINGTISSPDISSIQNALSSIISNQIDTAQLIAASCIARGSVPNSTFYITGRGGFPFRPGDPILPSYSTGDVSNIPPSASESSDFSLRTWQQGDPIIEATGVYQLSNGQLVVATECPHLSDDQITSLENSL